MMKMENVNADGRVLDELTTTRFAGLAEAGDQDDGTVDFQVKPKTSVEVGLTVQHSKWFSSKNENEEKSVHLGDTTVQKWEIFPSKLKKLLRINRKLLPLKILLLLIHGGACALFPYLTLHMRSIGLTFSEIGWIYAILPFVSSIGPPLGGALADRVGNYKVVMAGFTLLGVVTHLLLWFAVPAIPPPTIIIIGDSVFNLNVTFPCSAAEEMPSFVNTELFDQKTSNRTIGNSITSEFLSLSNCVSDCDVYKSTFPSICTTGPSASDCAFWSTLDGRKWTDVSVISNHGSKWTLANFTNENEQFVTEITCLQSTKKNCSVTCQAKADFFISTNRTISTPPSGRLKTLTLYMTFRFLAGIAVSTLFPIVDAAAYQMAAEHKGDLGFQRMFALIGACAFPPLSGVLIGLSSKNPGAPTDYSPAFYIFAAMHFIAAVIAYSMSLSLRLPATNIWQNVGRILRNAKVFMFVLMMFLAGCAWGFLENYLFLFMEDLGSPKWLFGMTNTISALSAIPVVAVSTLIMKYIGHTKILMMCFVLYGCRFLAYSFIYNPYHVLPVEVLEAFTTSLLWVVASVYCGKIAPDYLATLQGVIGSMHYAMGRGAGSLVGGLMFDYFKARLTYLIFGSVSIATGIFYAVLHYSWLRKISNPEIEDTKLAVHEPLLEANLHIKHELSKQEEHHVLEIAKLEVLSGPSLSSRSN